MCLPGLRIEKNAVYIPRDGLDGLGRLWALGAIAVDLVAIAVEEEVLQWC